MATKIVEVTDDTFEEEVLDAEELVLVDFYKDNCEACELLEPTLKSLLKEFKGRVKFVKSHAKTGAESHEEHGVEGYPTLTLFGDGEKIEEVPWNPGLPSADEIREFLEGHLEDDEEDEDEDEDDEDDEDDDEDDDDDEEEEEDELASAPRRVDRAECPSIDSPHRVASCLG
jgi:thioredoxin 1